MSHEQLQAAVRHVFERAGVHAFLFTDDTGARFVEDVRGLDHYRVRIAQESRRYACPFDSLADIVFSGTLDDCEAESHLAAIRRRLER